MSEKRVERRLTPRDGTLLPALIVERDELLRNEFAEGLALYGFDVRCACDAESAYGLADEFAPDVILLDWRLPGDSGILACRRLAAAHPGAAIVMLSEELDLRDRHSAWEAGAKSLLVKPVALEDVARELRRARGTGRFKRSRPARPPAAEEEAAAMREAYNRLRLVVDTARDAFVATAEDGTIEDCNPAAAVLFGWSREDLLGRDFAATLVPARLRAEHELQIRRFLDGEASTLVGRRSERILLRSDGVEVGVELTVAPMRLTDRLAFSLFARTDS